MASKRISIYTTSSCQYCDRLDTDDMVECDTCDLWFHFDCVGVDKDIADKDWNCDKCQFSLPKKTPACYDKENVQPSSHQWRNTKSIRTATSVCSTQSKVLALQQLDEERALSAKRDQEYLQRKYSILEDSANDYADLGEREHFDEKSSYENTLCWAKEVQQLSDDFSNKIAAPNVSISMDETEMNTFNKRFAPQAFSSTNVQRPKSIVPDIKANKRRNPFDVLHPGPASKHFPINFGNEKLPLQSKVPSHLFNSTCDDSGMLFASVKRNPIHPAKLQICDQVQQAVNVNFDPVDSTKVPIGLHSTQTTSKSKFTDFCSSTFRNDPPKLNFDKFGMTFVKQPSANAQVGQTSTLGQQQQRQQPETPSTVFGQFGVPFANQQFSNNPIPPDPPAVNRNIRNDDGSVNYKVLCTSVVNLTPSQIATRHTMDKKYPPFYGDPMRWQMFESAFVNATESCGLSNAENLSRLLDCLKGEAMTAVHCRLLHANNVPGVMETLRLMFGRPDLIIQTLLDEIDKTPVIASDDLESFVKFAILVQNYCSTIQACNSSQHLQSPLTLKKLVNKLPAQIRLNWACYQQSVTDVNIATFSDWTYALATVVSDVITINNSQYAKKAKTDSSKNVKVDNYANSTNSVNPVQVTSSTGAVPKIQKKCPACGRDFCKRLAFCETFKKLTRQDRWKLLKINSLCGCCLGNHRYFNCKQKVQCGVAGCSFFHHVLLHNDSKDNEKANANSNDQPKSHSNQKTCNSIHRIPPQLKFPEIFRIVPVKLFFDNQSMIIFAYFDDGSNLTTLELSVAQKLGINGTQESLCVKWSFGENQIEANSTRVSVHISGVHDEAETFLLDDVRTVKQLKLPRQSITKSWFNQYSYFDNIPITPYKDAVPQMIIGLRYSKLMVSLETVEGNWEQPIACRTRLGWVIQGPNDKQMLTNPFGKYSMNMCDCQASYHSLHQLVKEFFSLESFGVKLTERIIESKSMIRARNILESSTVKVDNHYEAALLWRSDDIKLPNSFDMAMRRLECVESKMKKNPILAGRMLDYFKDFLDKGYIRKLTSQEQQTHGPHTWYLPVFPVFSSKKPDKLRLVWDGAAKVNGVSLNSQLLVGPDQLIPLPDILRRFREACIGLSTDIIEMYHRIYVKEEDQDSQRFLWRDGDESREPDVFIVKVLPFGLTCSPAIAQFVKNKNAQSFKQQHPTAVEAITQNHYVDDMIERAHDVESAVKLIKDVQFIHRHANFDLRNLVSNDRRVLEAINGSPEFSDKILTNKLDINIERILGMFWNTKTDTFTYSLQYIKLQSLTSDRRPTKREVLRVIMSVFDPLGFLTHLLMHAKVLLQEIWRTNITWDQQIPPSLAIKWLR